MPDWAHVPQGFGRPAASHRVVLTVQLHQERCDGRGTDFDQQFASSHRPHAETQGQHLRKGGGGLRSNRDQFALDASVEGGLGRIARVDTPGGQLGQHRGDQVFHEEGDHGRVLERLVTIPGVGPDCGAGTRATGCDGFRATRASPPGEFLPAWRGYSDKPPRKASIQPRPPRRPFRP